MTAEQIKIKHSRLAIASFTIEIFTWTFFLAMLFLITNTEFGNKISTPIEGLKNDNFGLSGLLKGFIRIVFLLGIIPFLGHLSGLILGIFGFFQKRKKRVFAVSGLILSGIYFLILIILSISSAFFRSMN